MSRNIPTFLIPGNPLSPAVVSGKAVSSKAATARATSSSVQGSDDNNQPNTFAKALTKALKPTASKNESSLRGDKAASPKQEAKAAADNQISETETSVEAAPSNLSKAEFPKSETLKTETKPANAAKPSMGSDLESNEAASDKTSEATVAMLTAAEMPVSPLPMAPSAALLIQALPNPIPSQQAVAAVATSPENVAPASILEGRLSGAEVSPVVTGAVSIPMAASQGFIAQDTLSLKLASPSVLSPAALHASLAQPGVSQTGLLSSGKSTDASALPATEQTESALPGVALDASIALQALAPTLLASLPTAGGLATDVPATTPVADKQTAPIVEKTSTAIPTELTTPLQNTTQHAKSTHVAAQGVDSPEVFTMPAIIDTATAPVEMAPANPVELNPASANALAGVMNAMDTSDALPVGLFAEASGLTSNTLSSVGWPQASLEGADAADMNGLEAIAPQAGKTTQPAKAATNTNSAKTASVFANAQGNAASKSANGFKSLSEMDLDASDLESLTVESSLSEAATALPTPLELASVNGSTSTTATSTEATQSPLPPAFTSNAAHSADQVLEVAAYGAKNGQRELIIRLNPDNLGEVRITLAAQDGGGLSARLVASTPESHALLSSQAESLKTSLEAQGVRVDRLNVVLAGQLDSLQDQAQAALAAGSNFHSASDNGSSDNNTNSQQFFQEFSKDNSAFNSSMGGQSSDEGAAARQAAMNDSGAFQQRQNGYATNPSTGIRHGAVIEVDADLVDNANIASSVRTASNANHSGQVSVLA
jgi:Flagellar hook-length control protein FliK